VDIFPTGEWKFVIKDEQPPPKNDNSVVSLNDTEEKTNFVSKVQSPTNQTSSQMSKQEKQSPLCQKQHTSLRVGTIIRNEKVFPLIDLCDSDDDDDDNVTLIESKQNLSSNQSLSQNTSSKISLNTNMNNSQCNNMTNVNNFDNPQQFLPLSRTTIWNNNNSNSNNNNNNIQFPTSNYLYSPSSTLPSNIGIGNQTSQSSKQDTHFQSFGSSPQLRELHIPIQSILDNNNVSRIEDCFDDFFV
jgi:hypothetical protein